MSTVTTTVTSAAASGVVTTQTTTESTPEEAYAWDGVVQSWCVDVYLKFPQ